MARIIAGRFETQPQADRALQALESAGLARNEYAAFYSSSPGQHHMQPLGGDSEHHSEGTKESGKTAGKGAAIGGITGLALGTAAAAASEPGFTAVAAVAGAGIGAYAGSLAGGLAGSRQSDPDKATVDEPLERPAGIMVAVCVERAGIEERVIDTLRTHGARDIERAQGDWRDGAWTDFDPRRTPELIENR